MLVGAPGAGKTTVGHRLAGVVGGEFVDTDELVALAAGADSAAEVITEQGEQAFRELEREAVRTALAGAVVGAAASAEAGGASVGAVQGVRVVSVGGGAVADAGVRAMLREHPVVWLRVTAPNAASRIGLNAIRPVALGNIRAQFAAQLKARAPWYEEVSTLVVDTDHRDLEDITEEIRAWLTMPGATNRGTT